MNGIIAIIKLTAIAAIRSFSFISITLLTCALAIILPLLLTGDNSAAGLIQVRINYTMSICSTLIFFSTVWMGCSIIADDIENYKIHMLIVKPISKFKIWLGRFAGVSIVHIVLLTLVSVIIFSVINLVFYRSGFSAENKTEIKEKILTGNQNYISHLGNLDTELSKEYSSRIKEFPNEKNELTETEKYSLKKKIMHTLVSREGEVKPGESKTFTFDILKTKYPDKIILHFVPYIGSPDMFEMQNRPKVEGKWSFQIGNSPITVLSEKPEIFLSNNKYEKNIILKNIAKGENTIRVTYCNLDKDRSVFFRVSESPALQVKSTGFTENYLRCLLIMFLGIALLSAIGCALGGIFSFPVAVFVITAYLLFGSIGNFILSGNEVFLLDNDLQYKIGFNLSKSILRVITPIQKFQLSEFISSGILIENKYIYEILKKYFLLQFLAVSIIGIYIFSRRELGMVTKR